MPETLQTPPPPSQRMATETQHYELTLGDYLRILYKRRTVVLSSFVLVLVASIIYTNLKTPMYEASARVRISASAKAFQTGSNFFMPAYNFSTYENTVTSDEVLERVVVRLGLLEPDAKAADLTAQVSRLRGSITASQVGSTDLLNISVMYPDPELTAAVANQTADAFIEVDLLEKTREARKLRRFIEEQLMNFTETLRQTEAGIQEFRRSGRAMGIAIGLEQQLNNLQKEKTLLLKQFTEKHPDVIKINVQIERIRERLKDLPEDEIELARLQRELEISDRAYRMMKDKYQGARLAEAEQVSDVTIVSTASVPRVPVSPKKNLNKLTGALVGLIMGIILAFTAENFDTSIGTIEDVERIVRLPVIGVVPHYNPHREEIPWWRLDLQLMESVLKRTPRDLPPDSSFLIMNQDASSTLAEAYRILRTFVDFLLGKKEGEPGKIVLITSTGPQEGKTVTACNLAISLAQAGKKTLLIDGDLRRPAVHRLFGLSREPGLSDVLLDTVDFMEARRTLGDILVGDTSQWDQVLKAKLLDRLEVLTSGIATTTPAELLTSDAMKQLLERFRSQYDYIILDTPPVLPVTDTRGIGVHADTVFFVYRAGKTARRALTRANDELKLAGVTVRGIILNMATPEVTLTDKYYYQYYGEGGELKRRSGRT